MSLYNQIFLFIWFYQLSMKIVFRSTFTIKFVTRLESSFLQRNAAKSLKFSRWFIVFLLFASFCPFGKVHKAVSQYMVQCSLPHYTLSSSQIVVVCYSNTGSVENSLSICVYVTCVVSCRAINLILRLSELLLYCGSWLFSCESAPLVCKSLIGKSPLLL